MADEPLFRKFFESAYGGTPDNFHVARRGSELHVSLTYPPWTDADNKKHQLRYVFVDQESVRASDGLRLHYDYDRDGFVVEQCSVKLRKISDGNYDSVDVWQEVGFFKSWALGDPMSSDTDEAYAEADAEWERQQHGGSQF